MKIATRQCFRRMGCIMSAACAIAGWSAASGYAADAVPQLPPPPGVSSPAGVNLPMPTTPMMPAMPSSGSASDDSRTIANLETRVTDSVKAAIKGLNNGNGPLTLDDLNTARQAIAKLDALIDIQKRLSELNKLKEEQDKHTTLAAAIPASALSLPPPQSVKKPVEARDEGRIPSSPRYDVMRIVGASGHYEAELHLPDGGNKTVHVGDRLGDSTKVIAISADAVDLETAAGQKHLKVQGVGDIYGHSSY